VVLPSRGTLEIIFAVGWAISVGIWSRLEDPCMSQVRDLGQQRQVVATEAGGIFPLVAILVEPGQRYVVMQAVLWLICPDGSTNASHTDFVNRSVRSVLCHVVFSFVVVKQSLRNCSDISQLTLSTIAPASSILFAFSQLVPVEVLAVRSPGVTLQRTPCWFTQVQTGRSNNSGSNRWLRNPFQQLQP